MAIFNPVMKIFSEMMALPNFMRSRFLCLGVQDIEQSDIEGVIPDEFKFKTFGDLVRARGIIVDELDPFDARANIPLNLNYPIYNHLRFDENYDVRTHEEYYATVLDYGCIEHIFDTRMVIENCMRMVEVGGIYAVHTPVRNFANHGLHTFSQEVFPRAMEANGFEILFERYTTSSGWDIIADENQDVIGWYAGKKMQPIIDFKIPEQGRYEPKL